MEDIVERLRVFKSAAAQSWAHEAADEIESLRAQLAAANAEVQEQARLNGIGSEREAKLLAKLDEAYSEIARLIKLYNRTNETVWMWMEKNQLLQTENTTISQQLLATQAHAARLVDALGQVMDDIRSEDYLFDGGNGISADTECMVSKTLSTPISLDALHEALACECERLANMMASAEPATVVQLAGAIVALRREAADHRAKKEQK